MATDIYDKILQDHNNSLELGDKSLELQQKSLKLQNEISTSLPILRAELRKMIAEISESKHPTSWTESSVREIFTDIRAHTHRIVDEHYNIKPSMQPESNYTPQLGYWDRRLSHTEATNRLKGAIYMKIHQEILAGPSFGLDLPGIEEGLLNFERTIKSNPTNQNDFHRVQKEISIWRFQTLKCVYETYSAVKLEKVAQSIQDLMAPLLKDPNGQSKAKDALLQLCEKALKLTFALRSGDEFFCEFPDPGHPKYLDDIRIQGYEELQDGIVPQFKWQGYPIFASLVQYTQNERHVLERAPFVIFVAKA